MYSGYRYPQSPLQRTFPTIGFLMAAVLLAAPPAQPASTASDACVACHEKRSPGVVADWKLSRHSQVAVGCAPASGNAHKTDADASLARLPTPDTCNQCHSTQVDQFKKGKHAAAWAAVKAMPTFHQRPMRPWRG